MSFVTDVPNKLAFDEFGDVEMIGISNTHECGVILGIKFRSHVFAVERHQLTTLLCRVARCRDVETLRITAFPLLVRATDFLESVVKFLNPTDGRIFDLAAIELVEPLALDPIAQDFQDCSGLHSLIAERL
jgi:hypothetical protein